MTNTNSENFFERLVLAVFVGTIVAAFAESHRQPMAWVFELPCAASLAFRIKHLHPRLRSWTAYLSWVFVGFTVVLGLILMAYPVLSAQTATRLNLRTGYSLGVFSTLFLLGTRVWSPASTLFPATLGLFVVAGFNPSAPLRSELAVAGAAMFGYLATGRYTSLVGNRRASVALRRVMRMALSALATFVIAWGIIRLLPWAQTQVEQATFHLYSTQSTHYSSLSLHSRLGVLEELKLSTKVVMRVWSTRPQKLRGRVFTQFDGLSWHARELAADNVSPAPPGLRLNESMAGWFDAIPGTLFVVPGSDPKLAAEPGVIRTKVVQEVSNDGMLLSPGNKLLVRVPVTYLRIDAFEGLTPPLSSSIEIYGVANRRTGDIVQPGAASKSMIMQCEALLEDTDPRLKELAARLASGARGREELICRTVSYLQEECHYSLNVGKFHSRQPVAEFLFEKKKGYCEYFASAAAVLLRLQGVPTRYVTGFSIQEGNKQAGHYVVREADAHAWIEAYLPDTGWLEVDPTPEAEYQALHANLKGGGLDEAIEWAKAEFAEVWVLFQQGDWLAAFRWFGGQVKSLFRLVFVERFGLTLLFLALVAVATVGVLRWRKFSPRGRAPRVSRAEVSPVATELAELIFRLDDMWARQGVGRPASRAPLEHLNNLSPQKISPEVLAASRKAVEYCYRGCFGNARVEPAEVQELERSLERASRLGPRNKV